LCILGSNNGIDVNSDYEFLQTLPNAEVHLLLEPARKQLNDELWQQSWDILFFAGHSYSNPIDRKGFLQINQTEHLSIPELKYALRKAISAGLRLAIFNSCDGSGLAADITDLHIPQAIVMREPVPDRVAQEFLQNFLSALSQGTPFYQSLREARERLQVIEDEFPCASWLPILCQNLAEPSFQWPSSSANSARK
jgi:CHAT domain